MWNTITLNFQARAKRETFQGRVYLVAPMVMLTEGVHAGSNGPLFYSAAELSKNVAAWNSKPVTIRHPVINGQGVSACDPAILEKQGVGTIKNTKWEKGKLRADAWIDTERLQALAPTVYNTIQDGGIVEISTGLYTDNEYLQGHYGGKDFLYKATNFQPDHLAILPDQKGACAILDGCGLLQTNEESHTMNAYEQLPPLFGPETVLNNGTGDRDDNLLPHNDGAQGLPLPSMHFGPETVVNCGCADKAKAALDDDDIGLLLPIMNFDKPTIPTGNHGADDDDGLQLPRMVF